MSEKGDLEKDYQTAHFGGKLEAGQRPELLLVGSVMAYLDPACCEGSRGQPRPAPS